MSYGFLVKGVFVSSTEALNGPRIERDQQIQFPFYFNMACSQVPSSHHSKSLHLAAKPIVAAFPRGKVDHTGIMRAMANGITSMAKLIGMPTRGDVEVHIDHHYTSKIYSAGSQVNGTVRISPERDVAFSFVEINLLGKAHVRREDVHVMTETTHLLLKLYMPVPESAYPSTRVFKRGQIYSLPFRFIVPHQLTRNVCQHEVQAEAVRSYHLRLPSSLTGFDKDDLTTNMTKIQYSVRTGVFNIKDGTPETPLVPILESEHPISILAPSAEDPPLIIDEHDPHYVLKETSSVRKNMFSMPTGQITAESSQPQAIRLSLDGHAASSSSAYINIAFRPAAPDMLPPQVKIKSTMVLAQTRASPRPALSLPNVGGNPCREAITLSTPAIVESMRTTPWIQHVHILEDGVSERKAGGAKGSTDITAVRKSSSLNEGVPITHTCSTQVDFELPTSTHVFPPTFHSCLISRTYTLEIKITAGGSELTLLLPIQIFTDQEDECSQTPLEAELPSWDDVGGEPVYARMREHRRAL
ncbi:arrestin [Colletotrichum salicis]|uniref:Arrestin n=1 Tax=Colletotrichum salicis TaxID=1209931 RepID=A0A135S4X8_9PEZI|nr:arrestin [Colletotrichum salicis]